MTLPRLTVITPSLNQGEYLERAICSVLDQEYPDLEYIVMDGGSTDESVEILRRYDDRLAYWVSEPDQGQSWAINRAIERSTGEVIAYINSDDYYLPGAFEAALPPFQDPAVRWVAGTTEYREVDGTLHALLDPIQPTGSRANWVRSTWYVPQASSFWRRDVFEEFGFLRDDLHFVFDTEFGLRLAIEGLRPYPVERPLAVRYLQPEAKSADRSRFDREYKQVTKQLRRRLTRAERAQDRVHRALYAALRAQYIARKRLNLLHLRERWFGGRFARS
ncbi:MAG TPA: glycosyltransferase family 2 protein [Acidimicrobiales bacterium]|nr:glycosyltransferase family 2 protein [Acidimicrobiales bacterium]